MLKTRGRKILRDISSRRARTLLVSISIFVGVVGVVTLTSVGQIMMSQLEEDIDPEKLPMVVSFVDAPEDTTTSAATIETLRNYPEVTRVEGIGFGRIFWRKVENMTFTEAFLMAFSEPFEDIQIQPKQLIEGQYPVAGSNQIAIERRMAERYELGIDDTVVVRVFGDENTIEQTWTISGIVFDPYAGSDGEGQVYVTPEDRTIIANLQGFSAFYVRFTDFLVAEREFENFQEAIDEQTTYTTRGGYVENPEENEYIEEMRQWSDTLSMLGIVSMLVSSFLVVTVIHTLVLEQRRQIGAMKSLGASRWDNFAIYAGTALTYGVAGTLPGILIGIPAGYYLTQALAPLAGIYIEGFTIAPLAIFIGLLMGLAIPVTASIVPVYVGTRVTILEAMTDLGLSSRYGKGLWSRLIRSMPVPISIHQALASLSQKKTRLALTGFTLTLAVGAFMGVSSVFLALNDVIDDIYTVFNIDLGFFPDEEQDFEQLSGLVMENVDGIEAITPAFSGRVDVVTRQYQGGVEDTVDLFVTGFDTHTDSIVLDLTEGEAWANNPDREGIVLTKTAAESLGKGVGDTITVRHDTNTIELEIIGIDSFPFERGFTHWQTVASLYDEEIPNSFWVSLAKDDPTVQDADRAVDAIRAVLIENGVSAGFFNQVAESQRDAETILTIGLVFNIASAVMATIGAIGLLVTLFISVFERQREIGVMRSVGASSTSISSQFLLEGVLVGVIAWIIGVPLSYGLSLLLQEALPIGEFTLGFPIISLGLGLIGMLVVATVASLWPSISASRRTVSDILRYQ